MSDSNPWVEAANRTARADRAPATRAITSQSSSESDTRAPAEPAGPLHGGPPTAGIEPPAAPTAATPVPPKVAPPVPPVVPPATGPAVPQTSVAAPALGQGGLPVAMVRPTASLWVVGAHGGSGESCIAGLDPAWEAMRHAWPTPSDLSMRCPTALVARTHTAGLRAAQKALTQWASGALGPATALLGLVLVADAPGRLPRPLRELAAHVAGGAPRTWHVGWIESWRLGEPLAAADRPKPVRHLVVDLTALSGPAPTE